MSANLYSGVRSLHLVIDTPYDAIRTSDVRDDLIGVKVWYSTVSGFNPRNGEGTLAFDGSGLSIVISDLLPNTTYYVKYALISAIEPSEYTISAQYSAQVYSTTDIGAVATNTNSILAATVSVDAVEGAGFRAGDLTWDEFGNITGGRGVAITPGGLVGHNGTKTTMAIDAVTGDATFSGNLNAATGTFAGSLSAATGTFAGNLSAAGGSFSGDLLAASGRFTGTIQAGALDVSAIAGTSVVYQVAGTYNIPVPSNITNMKVTLLGGGGGGQQGWGAYAGLGGAGAGGEAGNMEVLTLAVSPGDTYTVILGAGGNPGTGYYGALNGTTANGASGSPGASSELKLGSTVLLTATGGKGGAKWLSQGIFSNAVGYNPTIGSETTQYGFQGEATEFAAGGVSNTAGSRASGGGGGNADNLSDTQTLGGKGGDGYVLVEFYNPNALIARDEFDALVSYIGLTETLPTETTPPIFSGQINGGGGASTDPHYSYAYWPGTSYSLTGTQRKHMKDAFTITEMAAWSSSPVPSNTKISLKVNGNYVANVTIPVGGTYGTELTETTVGISSYGDPFYYYVRFLSKFEGNDQGTVFTDAQAHALTRSGSVVTSSARYKFGTSSAYFPPATSSYLSTPDSEDFEFGSGDFCIDGWLYLTQYPTAGNTTHYGIVNKRSAINSQNSWAFGINSYTNRLTFSYTTTGTAIADPFTGGSDTKALLHFDGVDGSAPITPVLTESVTSITNSILGASSLTASTSPTAGSVDDGFWTLSLPWNFTFDNVNYNTVHIGTNSYMTFSSGSTSYSGLSGSNPPLPKIMINSADRSVQRIYYGVDSGTAPNRTYRIRVEGTSSSSGSLGSPNMVIEYTFYENNVQQVDIQIGVNAAAGTGITGIYNAAGTSINSGTFNPTTNSGYRITALVSNIVTTDTALPSRVWTTSGTPILSAGVTPVFGTTSLLLEGTSQLSTTSSVTDFAFGTGDFTLEGWIYSTSLTSAIGNILRLNGTYVTSLRWGSAAEGDKLLFSTQDGTTANMYSINKTRINLQNSWNHIAIVRQSGAIKLYLNGIQENLTQLSTGTTQSSWTDTTSISASAGLFIGGSTNGFIGNIDEMRISNIAVYTSPFVVPVNPFYISPPSGSYTQAVESAQDVPLNTWFHVAVVRSGTGLSIYQNGVRGPILNVGTNTLFNGTAAVVIGALNGTSSGFYTGYMDELRITKGSPRYTTAVFDVPTTTAAIKADDTYSYVDTPIVNLAKAVAANSYITLDLTSGGASDVGFRFKYVY